MPAPTDAKQDETLASLKDAENGAKGGPSKEFWPVWKLTLIALPQLGVQVLWCFLGPSSAPYMQHLGLTDALATLNNIAGPITGFFTGPLVGASSDKSTSRFGRRRPVILVGLISTWIAGLLFASSEHVLEGKNAIYFAAPMYWVMDVTINVLQTPHRALVADLASEEQQLVMQVVFVFLMSVGNFLGYTVMQIYPVATEHMLELMILVLGINTVCVGIQFTVAKETPLQSKPGEKAGCCDPVCEVKNAVVDSPRLLYHLAFVQCLVWVGLTSWNLYSLQWFTYSVHFGGQGDDATAEQKQEYADGQSAFTKGGQLKAIAQLVSSLLIILVLLQRWLPPRLVYAPCLFGGAVVSFLAAFLVQHNEGFATICMMLSVLPEVGSFAIPFGLVAVLNKAAEKEGKQVSTALQMALLNCCITVGQQLDTMTLAFLESRMSIQEALPLIFGLASGVFAVAGISALFLNDGGDDEEDDDDDDSGSE
jgi:Na+/melibiose symporter-like transporter